MANIKVITVGEPGVGKTALTCHYVHNMFQNTEMTIGVDFATKVFADGGKLQIWDTAGQESFRSISRSYYRGAHAVLLVFNLNDHVSFEKIKHWYSDLRNMNNDALCVLVGTKCELKHYVTREEIQQFCNELHINYYETSAKHAINVYKPFDYIYESLRDTVQAQKQHAPSQTQQTRYKCC